MLNAQAQYLQERSTCSSRQLRSGNIFLFRIVCDSIPEYFAFNFDILCILGDCI